MRAEKKREFFRSVVPPISGRVLWPQKTASLQVIFKKNSSHHSRTFFSEIKPSPASRQIEPICPTACGLAAGFLASKKRQFADGDRDGHATGEGFWLQKNSQWWKKLIRERFEPSQGVSVIL